MEDKQVFKVPTAKTKRRFPNLHCNETLDGLDDIWVRKRPNTRETAPDNTHAETGSIHQNSVRRSLVFQDNDTASKDSKTLENPDKCISMENTHLSIYKDDRESFSNATASSNVKDGVWSHSAKDKYTMGLLQEFNVTPENVRNLHAHTLNSNKIKMLPQPPDSSFSSRLDCGPSSSQTVPSVDENEIEIDCSDSKMIPDILIVRDDSMASADYDSNGPSEDDWEALTPPAPRSPSDHAVPDLEDLETVTPPSDLLIYPNDNLLAAPVDYRNFGYSEDARHVDIPARLQPGYLQLRQMSQIQQFSDSAFDHVVPDFYI